MLHSPVHSPFYNTVQSPLKALDCTLDGPSPVGIRAWRYYTIAQADAMTAADFENDWNALRTAVNAINIASLPSRGVVHKFRYSGGSLVADGECPITTFQAPPGFNRNTICLSWPWKIFRKISDIGPTYSYEGDEYYLIAERAEWHLGPPTHNGDYSKTVKVFKHTGDGLYQHSVTGADPSGQDPWTDKSSVITGTLHATLDTATGNATFLDTQAPNFSGSMDFSFQDSFAQNTFYRNGLHTQVLLV